MTFYIATAFKEKDLHRSLTRMLQAAGRHRLTYDWTAHEAYRDADHRAELARADLAGVAAADCLVVLLPGGAGTHAELGFALGLRAAYHPTRAPKVVVWSWDGSHFEAPNAPPFYFADGVERVTGPLADLVAYLS